MEIKRPAGSMLSLGALKKKKDTRIINRLYVIDTEIGWEGHPDLFLRGEGPAKQLST